MGQASSTSGPLESNALAIVPTSIAPAQPANYRRKIDGNTEEVLLLSRKERLAIFAPLLSSIRPWLFVAGHEVEWPSAHEAMLINLASEVPFLESNLPPGHIRPKLDLALRDGPTQELQPFLPRILEAIEETKGAVILMCQQGVSRSCAAAIAVLMCHESLSYEVAFSQVKAARDVCSPNAGFICQLMELAIQKNNKSKRPTVFRFTPHAAHDSPTLVLKPCLVPGTRVLAQPWQVHCYSHGIFLVIATDCIHLWRGRYSLDTDSNAAVDEIRKWYRYVWCDVDNMPHIVVEREGEESDAFHKITQAPPDSIEQGKNGFDYEDQSWRKIPDARAVENSKGAPINESECPLKPQFSVLSTIADSWERLNDYDSSDLVPDQVGWLNVPDGPSYIWLGRERESSCTPKAIMKKLGEKVDDQANVIIVHEGKESAAFWDTFEAGY
ncbi:hypothetical protein Ae201684_002120 [Aphanomyces euteiches]|uniref:Tyrosine specific protein phosphatases domain-containing protein n=1 Tax=Aphanomyces euteiches TaxID=100861 RepID=A0A6G0XRW0_9STRA|nr:hypothetical protein Ae201684_002120 [Aphanomyces euteiches]KAH9145211.1 hypothetical protein AeRB84_010844 [Aphanomyces euteiches]